MIIETRYPYNGRVISFEYDALDRPVAVHLPDGISTCKAYNARNQRETQANLVLIYLIVGENVYVCTESMKDAFLDRPSRLKIQAERMDLVQFCHIGRYGARVCQVAVGIGKTALGIWTMRSGMLSNMEMSDIQGPKVMGVKCG